MGLGVEDVAFHGLVLPHCAHPRILRIEARVFENRYYEITRLLESTFSKYSNKVLLSNYGHDDFSIGLLRDTTPHVECYDVIYGAKHSFL